jgi:hypothetical protein
MHSDELWAVSCYFNPVGYARRLQNYRIFRKQLAVPLLAVELSFNGRFELTEEDADILIQLAGGHVMWQKERLLNIGIARLPAACSKIAWLDCDIVFGDSEWMEKAIRALDEFSLVHLFQERHDVKRDTAPDELGSWRTPPTSESVVYKMSRNEAMPEDLFLSDAPLERRTTAGLAWASRRDVLAKHGLYDACVLGSGDRTILSAALGEFQCGARASLMNVKRIEHYDLWARPYHESVRGRVGYIPGRVFHLWHGRIEDRQYGMRHRKFEKFDFDPFTDIALSDNGCWRWSSNKPELHAFVRAYFESRNEDGGH